MRGGHGHPWPLPESATDEHTNGELSGSRLLDQVSLIYLNIPLSERRAAWWGDWDNAHGWCQTTLPECAGHLCTERPTVQRSPAQYKETDTHRNAIMYTSSVINNAAAAAAVRSLHVTWNRPPLPDGQYWIGTESPVSLCWKVLNRTDPVLAGPCVL